MKESSIMEGVLIAMQKMSVNYDISNMTSTCLNAVERLYLENQDMFSPVFPNIWLVFPLFFSFCFIVRLIEGPVKQGFNFSEAKNSFLNCCILGSLTSFGPLMKYFLRDEKVTMTPLEMVWKLGFVIVVVDFVFYWLHRAMHENQWLYKHIHSRHHSLGPYHTVWGALDEDFLETFTIFGYLVLPFVFIDVTPEFFIFVFAGGAIQTALIHGTKGNFPPWPLCNANFHHGHHCFKQKNFSANLVIWDDILGTKRVEKVKE